jgi:hypothetical protein
MWPLKKEPKYADFKFQIKDLTPDEKIELLYDHLFLAGGRKIPENGAPLVLRVSVDSIDTLTKRSYFSKLYRKDENEGS